MTTERVGAPVVGLGLVCMIVMVYFVADAAFGRLGVPALAVGVGPLAVSGAALVPAMATAYPYVRSPYFRAIVLGIAPLAALIGFTLGTIVGGLATPTEAASCGAFGATLLALVYGRLDLKAVTNAAMGTMVTVAMVVFLAMASEREPDQRHQRRDAQHDGAEVGAADVGIRGGHGRHQRHADGQRADADGERWHAQPAGRPRPPRNRPSPSSRRGPAPPRERRPVRRRQYVVGGLALVHGHGGPERRLMKLRTSV